MRSYQAFAAFLAKGRSGATPGRRLCHETRVYYTEPGPQADIAIRYYRTEIIRFFADGRIWINANGYTTRTTLERLNNYTPYSFYMFKPNRYQKTSYFAIDLNGGWRWYRPEPKHRRGCYLISTPDVEYTHVFTWPDKRIQPRYAPDLTKPPLHSIEWWCKEIARRKQAQARKDARERALWYEARDDLLRAQRRMTVTTPAGNIDASKWLRFLRQYCHAYQTAETQINHWEHTANSMSNRVRELLTQVDQLQKHNLQLQQAMEALRLSVPMFTDPDSLERQRVVTLSAT